MTSAKMYREHILDLWRNPMNFGEMQNATHKYKESNPICGDEIELLLEIKNNFIKNARFKGSGCAISIASASLLTENIKNKSLIEINKISENDVIKNLKIPISPVRIKCALLPFHALKKAIFK
ncbi:MAG: iron-sulfur cluster assembly scaffold protein [Candidatus Pacearchaeota archaeon]